MSNTSFKTLRVYACGGTGVNLASKFANLIKEPALGMCNHAIAYLDTSMSNIRHTDVNEENVYHFEGKDGSGKLLAMNYEDVVKKAPEFMSKFRPSEDINIIVSSASGGSGSIIGQVIAAHLLERDLPFVVLLVGSTYSERELINTTKVLQGYENQSGKHNHPVIAHYLENNETITPGDNDRQALDFMTLVSLLFSGHHKSLDSADLRNFMDYTTVTSYPAKLICMDFYSDQVEVHKGEKVYTMASLGADRVAPDILVDYHAEGFMVDEVKDNYPHPLPLRCITIDGRIQNNMKVLQEKIERHVEQKRVGLSDRIIDKKISSEATDLGIIL